MNRWWIVFLIVLAAPAMALACSCLPPPAPPVAFKNSDFVFSGRVICAVDTVIMRSRDGQPRPPNIFSSGDLIGWSVQVDQVWKGRSADTLLVYTPRMGASCGFRFQTNVRYLIYGDDITASDLSAQFVLEALPDSTLHRVSLCSRTAEIGAAADDILALPPPESRNRHKAE